MKTVRHYLTACLTALVLVLSAPGGALADEGIATGVIKQISSDHRGLIINGVYYQLDRNTVVHAPGTDRRLSVDKLTAGTQIGFRSKQTASGSVVPRIAEVWIYVD
jgi:hypothetical protein